jgi:hypothetical protein
VAHIPHGLGSSWLLDAQVERRSPIESDVLTRLAVEREPVNLPELVCKQNGSQRLVSDSDKLAGTMSRQGWLIPSPSHQAVVNASSPSAVRTASTLSEADVMALSKLWKARWRPSRQVSATPRSFVQRMPCLFVASAPGPRTRAFGV